VDKFKVKGFLDFGRLFKHLSKQERLKRKEEATPPQEKGEKNTSTPTKGA